MDLGHIFQPAPNHFRERTLAIRRHSFGTMKKIIWYLHLRLDHDGRLPSWVKHVNFGELEDIARNLESRK